MSNAHFQVEVQVKFSSIEVNLNFPGVLPLLRTIVTNQGTIMADLQALLDKVTELETANSGLVAKVEEGNNKTDELIVVASQTKDALVALQGQANPDFQAVIDRLGNVIASSGGAVASIAAQEEETDAAKAADAP